MHARVFGAPCQSLPGGNASLYAPPYPCHSYGLHTTTNNTLPPTCHPAASGHDNMSPRGDSGLTLAGPHPSLTLAGVPRASP